MNLNEIVRQCDESQRRSEARRYTYKRLPWLDAIILVCLGTVLMYIAILIGVWFLV